MIIALFGNNDLKTLLAKAIIEKAPNINFEVKSMADLPDYRPNVIGEQRDNWIICDAESVEAVKKDASITIGIEYFEDKKLDPAMKYIKYMSFNWSISESKIYEFVEALLVSEKLIYPKTVE